MLPPKLLSKQVQLFCEDPAGPHQEKQYDCGASSAVIKFAGITAMNKNRKHSNADCQIVLQTASMISANATNVFHRSPGFLAVSLQMAGLGVSVCLCALYF